jgi:hypothetical protein
MKRTITLTVFLTVSAIAAVVFAASAAQAATSGYQPFSSAALAAKRATYAAHVGGIHLFHPCTAVNPYLIRCGGYVPAPKGKAVAAALKGLGPKLSKALLAKMGIGQRLRIEWRKLNPYMLEQTTYTAAGNVLDHRFIDARVAY